MSGKLEQETHVDVTVSWQLYTDIQELTPEIVREFIEKIVVHARSELYKKKNYIQQI